MYIWIKLSIGLSCVEVQRDIHQRATGDLEDAGLESIHLRLFIIRINN